MENSCPRCNAYNPTGSLYCLDSGTDLGNIEIPPVTPTQLSSQQGPGCVILYAIVAIITLITDG